MENFMPTLVTKNSASTGWIFIQKKLLEKQHCRRFLYKADIIIVVLKRGGNCLVLFSLIYIVFDSTS